MEKRVPTVIGGAVPAIAVTAPAILGLLGWLFIAVQDLTVVVARQDENIDHLARQVSAGVDDRYRARDAERDFKARDERIADMERRLDHMERVWGEHLRSIKTGVR
jgi:hypothetical protein